MSQQRTAQVSPSPSGSLSRQIDGGVCSQRCGVYSESNWSIVAFTEELQYSYKRMDTVIIRGRIMRGGGDTTENRMVRETVCSLTKQQQINIKGFKKINCISRFLSKLHPHCYFRQRLFSFTNSCLGFTFISNLKRFINTNEWLAVV